MKMEADTLVPIAVLKAKAGMRDALRRELLKLRDESGTFYMREAFVNQAALDTHCATDYFQAFARQANELLAEPLRLVFMEEVSPSSAMGPG